MSNRGKIFEYNITELYQQVFGSKPVSLSLKEYSKANDDLNKPESSIVSFDQKQVSTSKLGTALYDNDNALSFGREYFLPATLDGVRLPYACMRIQGRKTVVETPMIHRQGKVVELISLDDYVIKIRGFFIAEEFPDAELTQLRKWHETLKSVSLQSALSDIFLKGNDSVVMLGFDLPEVRGKKGIRAYEMDLVSNNSFALKIN
jgi:hypothetical protein